MNRIDVKKDGNFCYSICFKSDFSKLAGEIVNLGFEGRKICIVTDSNVAPLYLENVKMELSAKFESVFTYTIPAGEQNKTLDQVKNIYEYLILNHFDRKDCLIALVAELLEI